MGDQLPLLMDGRRVWEHYGEQLLELIRTVVDVRGVKQVAYDLDLRPSDVSNALAQRDRHYFRIEHLPYFLLYAPGPALVEFLARVAGYELMPAKPVTPEEQLHSLRRAMEESMGPELRAAIERKARGFLR